MQTIAKTPDYMQQSPSDGADLISREDAIEAVCTMGTELERNGKTMITMVDAKYAFIEILEALPSAEAEWIPCETSGMPPEGEAVLMSDGNRIWIDETVAWWGDRSDWIGTAWMPLPKPYKGGDTE